MPTLASLIDVSSMNNNDLHLPRKRSLTKKARRGDKENISVNLSSQSELTSGIQNKYQHGIGICHKHFHFYYSMSILYLYVTMSIFSMLMQTDKFSHPHATISQQHVPMNLG